MSFQSGLPVTVVRPHNVYGPRMGLAHVIPELLQRAHEAEDGGRLGVHSVEHRRTFCHVSDAVEMMARAALAPDGVGRTPNIGKLTPEIRIGDLAELIIEVVGRHTGDRAPATASWLAGATLPGHDADPRGDWLRRGGRHRGRRPGNPRLVPTERIRGVVVKTRFADQEERQPACEEELRNSCLARAESHPAPSRWQASPAPSRAAARGAC